MSSIRPRTAAIRASARPATTATLSIKVGKFGAFVGCSNYPECKFTRALGDSGDGEQRLGRAARTGPRPNDRRAKSPSARARTGFISNGAKRKDDKKPKRVAIPKGSDPARDRTGRGRAIFCRCRVRLGKHPESGKKISAGIGRFGPFIRHDGEYRSLGDDEDVLTVGLNRAVALVGGAQAAPRTEGAEGPWRASPKTKRRLRCWTGATAPM